MLYIPTYCLEIFVLVHGISVYRGHGIDLTPKEILSSGNISNDILEAHFSDHKEVDIAIPASLAASEGAIQESDGDASGQRPQCRPQFLDRAQVPIRAPVADPLSIRTTKLDNILKRLILRR
jgi:hypothetical protein